MIDYKKAYEIFPLCWIISRLKIYKISEVINCIENTMQYWRVQFTAGGKGITEEKMQSDIFQRNALSSLLFVIAMMPHKHILRKCTAGYNLTKSQEIT